MRTLDAPVRIVLATLIIRYRAARRDHARTRAQFGSDHVATVAADARVTELWNTMHSVRTNLQDELEGSRVSVGDTHAFVNYVRLGAGIRRGIAQRSAAQA